MVSIRYRPPYDDASSVVVWPDSRGRPVFGPPQAYHAMAGDARERVPEHVWSATVEAAVASATRSGIPTVYVVKR